MATIKLKLTEEHLMLISNIRYGKLPEMNDEKEYINYGIDFNSFYGGSFLLEDISYILGLYDKHIQGTEENYLGADFPEDVKDHMLTLHLYIMENLDYIENLVHYYSNKGGLTPGTYKCKDYNKIWEKID